MAVESGTGAANTGLARAVGVGAANEEAADEEDDSKGETCLLVVCAGTVLIDTSELDAAPPEKEPVNTGLFTAEREVEVAVVVVVVIVVDDKAEFAAKVLGVETG